MLDIRHDQSCTEKIIIFINISKKYLACFWRCAKHLCVKKNAILTSF